MPNCLSAIYGVSQTITIELLQNWVTLYERLVASKGEVYTIDLLKKIHGICIRFAANSSFEVIDFLKCDQDKIPVMVSCFVPLLKGSVNDRRCALCILSLFKMVLVRGDDPSLGSIIKPFEPSLDITFNKRGEFLEKSASLMQPRQVFPSQIGIIFREVLEEMFPRRLWKARLNQVKRSVKIHVSSRNGPNGQAIAASYIDLVSLKETPDLYKPLSKLAELLNHKDLVDLLNLGVNETSYTALDGKSPIHSRLSIKAEPGAKTRFFAIVDYFTQSALKGFHNWIFKFLSRTPEDGTLSQDRACALVKQWTINALDGSSEVYSADLSKATDRLPAFLQREIVWQVLGKDFADLWYTIVTARDFQVPNQSDTVRFVVGQPLGAYSSWAMLALTHHVLSRVALKLAGMERDASRPSYVVVGDDSCLVGRNFSKYYHIVMTDLCKVETSPLKGFSPETLSGANPLIPYTVHSVAEFCKRVYYNGMEISTVSPITLKESLEYPVNFPMLVSDLNKRTMFTSLDALARLAWLNFNPDQALMLVSFPLSSALPSNILEELEVKAKDLGIPWYDHKDMIMPLWTQYLLEEVRSSIDEFVSKIGPFKSSLTQEFATSSFKIEAPIFYSKVLNLVCDQISYSTVKLVERVKPKAMELRDLKQVVDGLIDLDDLRDLFSGKTRKGIEDRPKQISRRIATLIKSLSNALRSDLEKSVEAYNRYYSLDSFQKYGDNSDLSDIVTIPLEDDWELVVPILQDGQDPNEVDDF